MSNFSFTATASCDKCGAFLSSSDEDCDHNGDTVSVHVFRRMGAGRDSMKGVESTARHKWHRLEDKVGSEWVTYEYLGRRESVESMLSSGLWNGIADLPKRGMSLDAPSDVAQSED